MEKEKVLEIWKQGNKALENNDWESYSLYWAHTDYIQIIHPREMEWLRGWDTIGPGYKKLIEQGADIETETSDVDIHISKDGQMAWLTCNIYIKISGKETMEFESWQTSVFEKINGDWKLVHSHASNLY